MIGWKNVASSRKIRFPEVPRLLQFILVRKFFVRMKNILFFISVTHLKNISLPSVSLSRLLSPLSCLVVSYLPSFFIICMEAATISFKIKIYITGRRSERQYHTAKIYGGFRKDPAFLTLPFGKCETHFLFVLLFCYFMEMGARERERRGRIFKIIGINTTVFY